MNIAHKNLIYELALTHYIEVYDNYMNFLIIYIIKMF